MRFPYQGSDDCYYPVIKIAIISKKEKVILTAVVDSGANISLFSEEVAECLGIPIESGKKMYLGGVGGRIIGYRHHLEVETAGKRFLCSIVFSREFKVSFNLLGRENFFEKFIITFD